MRQFLTGNEIMALAAHNCGAKLMFGYPITPSTEIMETWVKFCSKDNSLSFLQTEDEMAAGFATIGACLAGIVAFTATAGPGNVLMQDAFSMAEALRVPTVGLITQRGGLSTSTVIYSQQEVRLTCFGGNGEGFRIVYSPSGLQDLYDLTLKAFSNAWKYRFPSFVLADGYQAKMKGVVEIPKSNVPMFKSKPILKKGVNLRNCYNLEEEINDVFKTYQKDYEADRERIEEAEIINEGSKTFVLAHGIVAPAAKEAINQLSKKGRKIGLFRPITLRPFPKSKAALLKKASRVIIFESAIGQLKEIFKNEVDFRGEIFEYFQPSLGFTPEIIYENITKIS